MGCKFTPNLVFSNNVWASTDTPQAANLFNTADQQKNYFLPNAMDFTGIGFFNCDNSNGGRACTAANSDYRIIAHSASGASPFDAGYRGSSTDGKDLGAYID